MLGREVTPQEEIKIAYQKYAHRRKILLITAATLILIGIGFIIGSAFMPLLLVRYIGYILIVGTFSGSAFGFLNVSASHDKYLEAQSKSHSDEYKESRKTLVLTIGMLMACSTVLVFISLFVPYTSLLFAIADSIGVSTVAIGLLGTFGLLKCFYFEKNSSSNALTDLLDCALLQRTFPQADTNAPSSLLPTADKPNDTADPIAIDNIRENNSTVALHESKITPRRSL